jgi:transposase
MKEIGSPKIVGPTEQAAEAPERRPGERSEPGRSGGASAKKLATSAKSCHPLLVPNPEVLEKPIRRNFTAEYKLRILKEVDALSESGQIGALLRREGLYSSHLTTWRRQRNNGTLDALQPKKRGRKSPPQNPLAPEIEQLRRQNDKLVRRLKQAEAIIDFQKKISELLGIPLTQPEVEGNDS